MAEAAGWPSNSPPDFSIAGERSLLLLRSDLDRHIENRRAEGLNLGAVHAEIVAALERAGIESAPCGAVLISLDSVVPEEVAWLWPGRIALGKLTLLCGDPGLGKSALALDCAARISRGAPWPDTPQQSTPVGEVIVLSAEDGAADTLRPRLDAANADPKRILLLEGVRERVTGTEEERQRPFSLEKDLAELERALIARPHVRLVVIDPVTAYCGKTDSHRNTEVRGLLAPLAALAAKYRVAVLAITHLNKTGGGPAIYRAMGSLAFAAAARAVWLVAKDRDDPERRLFLPVKNNLAATTPGMAFSMQGSTVNTAPVVVWEPDPVELSADEVLNEPTGTERGASRKAESFLRATLAGGAVPAGVVLQRGADAGISEKTLRRAGKEIGVRHPKAGFQGGWLWALPEDAQAEAPKSEGAQPRSMGTFDGDGHLGAVAL